MVAFNSNPEVAGQPTARSAAFRPQKCSPTGSAPHTLFLPGLLRHECRAPSACGLGLSIPASEFGFKAAMEKVGVRCDMRIFEGRTHSFFNYGRGVGEDYCKDYYDTLLDTDRFLASLGWLVGPPTLKRPPLKVERPAQK